jgi:hypothetical protein
MNLDKGAIRLFRMKASGISSNRGNTIILALIALPFVCGALYMTYRSLWFQFAAVRAEGTVIEILAGTPTLTVEFPTGKGETLRTTSVGSDLYSGISRGDRLAVFFDPNNPVDARINLFVENWLLPLITMIPAAIILLVAWGLRGNAFSSRRPRLKSGGTRVQAEFVRVRIEMDMERATTAPRFVGSLSINDDGSRCELIHNGVTRDPYDPEVQRELGLCNVIEALWTDPKTGMKHLFHSEPLSNNPESQLKGRTITVYMDPKRPHRYRMELPFQQKEHAPDKRDQGFRGNV